MRMSTFVLAAAAALICFGQVAQAQYGPMGGPAGAYPSMMAPSMMGAGPGGMPGPSPYAPPAFAPAAYAGIGGPAPMGMPGAPGMAGMPMGAPPMEINGMGEMAGQGYGGPGYGGMGYGGPEYCNDCGGWTNRYFVFGEALLLRPRNAEVAYAVPVDSTVIAGAGSPIVPIGPVRVADPDYTPGFRIGFGSVMGPRSAMAVTYTQYDRNTFDALSIGGGPGVVRSLVTHPNVLTAAGNGLDTAAILQTEFELLDVDYKGLWIAGPQTELAWVVGARYGNLEQHLAVGFAPATGFEEVLAETEFDGGGIKLGLDGLRRSMTSQFFVYGKGSASFLAGDFRSRYQFNSPTLANNVDTSHKVGRVVTVLDLETGVGWQNFTGNLRFSMGYMFSSWLNTVKVDDFIQSVQQNNYVGSRLSDSITFDGLTGKIELLW
jgi:hypothetical protein